MSLYFWHCGSPGRPPAISCLSCGHVTPGEGDCAEANDSSCLFWLFLCILALALGKHVMWNSALYTGLCPSHHSIQGKDACKSSPLTISYRRKEITAQRQVLPSCHHLQLLWEPLHPLTLIPLHLREEKGIWSYSFINGKKWSYLSKAEAQYINVIIFKRGENVQKVSCHSRLWSRVSYSVSRLHSDHLKRVEFSPSICLYSLNYSRKYFE